MLIAYLLLVRPLPFLISLLLLICCNVMKWLEAARGSSLAGVPSVDATSRPLAEACSIVRGWGEQETKGHREWGRGWAGDSRQ